jgi:hypothetical protein
MFHEQLPLEAVFYLYQKRLSFIKDDRFFLAVKYSVNDP